MTTIWAGYRYTVFTFLLLNPAFVLIISAQNIETGGLIGGGQKSHIFTLIVSIFSTFFLGIVLWFDLVKRVSVISEVRWELIWVATITLFNIIGIASISSNRPAPDTCTRADSDWNICAASGGIIALLILATLALVIHGFALIVLVIRQSGKTPLSIWPFMARELPYALKPAPPPADFAPGITSPYASNEMIQVDLERPKSLPPVPQPTPPPVAVSRDPFTFSTISSLLNMSPRQEEEGMTPRGYQLYDAPITPVPVARPPVQRAFERVSRTDSSGHGGFGSRISGYYTPTPLYERFARGGRDREIPIPSARPAPSPPLVAPLRPRRKDGDLVQWHARDEFDLRRARTQTERDVEPAPARDPNSARSLPSRTRPPRIERGTLPNPNAYRPSRE
ncbi:hypothetical protein RhiJN_03293 [Ceratobasidium sp. AG-Ba]|nr:hypothetical protein RhiJN_03293 [Ceratobasidium sp. AG-Ba]QRW04191.1 hypothetical protein RhiLY_03190 [Ceratobasidium sp. AG-Ba]